MFALYAGTANWAQVSLELERLSPAEIFFATLASLVSLIFTALSWAVLFARTFNVSFPQLIRYFFLGQLGKYLPGGVWSFAGQAELLKRNGVNRTASWTLGVFWLFLSAVVGLCYWMWAILSATLARGLWQFVLSGLIALLLGGILSVGAFVAFRGVFQRISLKSSQMLSFGFFSGLGWVSHGFALSILMGYPLSSLVDVTAAYAVAFVGGLLIPFSPAGLGVREAIFMPFFASNAIPAFVAVSMYRLIQIVLDIAVALASLVQSRFR